MSETPDAAENAPEAVDDWGSAMAEQSQATPEPTPVAAPESAALPAGERVFQPLFSSSDPAINKNDIDRVMDIPVQLTAELGRTRITINSLLQLSQGSVVELDGLAGQPMDVFINGYLIAQGEVVVVNDKFGIRLTDIITPSERIQKVSK